MYGKRKNPNVEAMTQDIQNRFGILINYKAVGEILSMKSPTAINRWIRENEILPAGRRGYYYSRDIAKAMFENGGVLNA